MCGLKGLLRLLVQKDTVQADSFLATVCDRGVGLISFVRTHTQELSTTFQAPQRKLNNQPFTSGNLLAHTRHKQDSCKALASKQVYPSTKYHIQQGN